MRITSLLIFRLTMTAALAFLLLPGCAKPKPAPRPAPAKTGATPAPVRTVPRPVGEVAIVEAENGFVLVDLGSSLYVPEPGETLHARNAHGETAKLKASAEQNRPFVAADIVEGHPQVGDEVYR